MGFWWGFGGVSIGEAGFLAGFGGGFWRVLIGVLVSLGGVLVGFRGEPLWPGHEARAPSKAQARSSPVWFSHAALAPVSAPNLGFGNASAPSPPPPRGQARGRWDKLGGGVQGIGFLLVSLDKTYPNRALIPMLSTRHKTCCSVGGVST